MCTSGSATSKFYFHVTQQGRNKSEPWKILLHPLHLFTSNLAASKFQRLVRQWQWRQRRLTTNRSSCTGVLPGRALRMSCDCSPMKVGQGWAHGEVTALSEHTWTEIKQSERVWHCDKSPFWFSGWRWWRAGGAPWLTRCGGKDRKWLMGVVFHTSACLWPLDFL